MRYYGIKTPEIEDEGEFDEPYIWWFAGSEHKAWDAFFMFPDKKMFLNSHRAPLAEAIRAYESIGYKCVELEVTEK